MSAQTVPPTSRRPEEWLAWLAAQSCMSAAIDTAVAADMHFQIIAYATGKWIAENRQDELAARISADFARLEEVLAR